METTIVLTLGSLGDSVLCFITSPYHTHRFLGQNHHQLCGVMPALLGLNFWSISMSLLTAFCLNHLCGETQMIMLLPPHYIAPTSTWQLLPFSARQ